MKKTLLSLALTLGIASTSSASLLVYEGFNYTPGSLLNEVSGSGTGFSRDWAETSAGGSAMPVTSGLAYGDLAVSGNGAGDIDSSAYSIERGIANAAALTQAGQKQWFSYLLSVPADVTTGQFYVTFFGNTTYTGIGTRTNFSNGNLVLHANRDGNISGSLVLAPDQTHLIVGSLDWTSSNSVNLNVWVDPDLSTLVDETHLGTVDLNTQGTVAVGDWLWLRGNGGVQAYVDEIRLGTTLADVTPVPEPSTYAVLCGAVAMGVVMIRRRSKSKSETCSKRRA